jgi:hypothetical protein
VRTAPIGGIDVQDLIGAVPPGYWFIGLLVQLVIALVWWIIRGARREIDNVRADRDARLAEWQAHAEEWRGIVRDLTELDKARSAQHSQLLDALRVVEPLLRALPTAPTQGGRS